MTGLGEAGRRVSVRVGGGPAAHGGLNLPGRVVNPGPTLKNPDPTF